jgi:hypothetical protein
MVILASAWYYNPTILISYWESAEEVPGIVCAEKHTEGSVIARVLKSSS